jgi:hypothetical protein
MTTYDRVLQLLADREWHPTRDLIAVSNYPREWIRELQRRNLIEVLSFSGDVRVRLK